MKPYIILISFVLLCMGCSEPGEKQTFDQLVQAGDAYLVQKEYLNAAKALEKAHKINPEDISLMLQIADTYLKMSRLERAKVFLNTVLEKNPDHIQASIKLAQIYFFSFDLSKTEEICKRFEEKKIEHFEFDLIRADLLLNYGQHQRAYEYYKKAADASNGSIRAKIKLAIILKHLNKSSESKKIISEIRQIGQLPVATHLLLSDYYLLADQYELAETSIYNAIKISPTDQNLKYRLIQFYLATGNLLQAKTYINSLPELSSNTKIQMVLADIHITLGNLKQAEQLILSLKEKIKWQEPELELLQAKYWSFKGKSEYAVIHLKSALKLKPGLVNARYLLGLSQLLSGKNKLSENNLSTNLIIDPDHYRSLVLIAQVLYKQEKYHHAIEVCTQIIETYPEDFNSRLLRGLSRMGLAQYDDAIIQLEEAKLLTDKPYIPAYYIALCHELSGQKQKALTRYSQILTVKPELMDVSYRYAMLLVKTDQLSRAQTFVKQTLAKDNTNPQLYRLASKVSAASNQIPQAISYLKQALEFNNVSGLIYLDLAQLYTLNKQSQKALEILHDCTEKKPLFKPAWVALAKQYEDEKDLISAIQVMEKAYKTAPDNPVFQTNLAWLLLENKQDLNRAMVLAQSAFDSNCKNPAFMDTLGWAYYHKGVYSQASALFLQALDKEPDNGFIRYHLGMTYFNQGKIEKAKSEFELALKSKQAVHIDQQIDSMVSTLSISSKPIEKKQTVAEPENLLMEPDVNTAEDDIITPW